jgi:hypothetical protein
MTSLPSATSWLGSLSLTNFWLLASQVFSVGGFSLLQEPAQPGAPHPGCMLNAFHHQILQHSGAPCMPTRAHLEVPRPGHCTSKKW